MVEESKPTEAQKLETAVTSAEQQVAQAVREGEPIAQDSGDQIAAEPLIAEHCTIDDLMKADLRVARVVAAKQVEGADKLLQLTLSLGGDVTRNVFAGIKKAYKPEELIGQLVICCSNLKPRQMKFGLSEGMVLAVGPGASDVFLLRADSGAKPGMRVH